MSYFKKICLSKNGKNILCFPVEVWVCDPTSVLCAQREAGCRFGFFSTCVVVQGPGAVPGSRKEARKNSTICIEIPHMYMDALLLRVFPETSSLLLQHCWMRLFSPHDLPCWRRCKPTGDLGMHIFPHFVPLIFFLCLYRLHAALQYCTSLRNPWTLVSCVSNRTFFLR